MPTSAKRGSLDHLVDPSGGQISREIFVNEDLYQQEQEQVFTRAWLFVGHEDQIPNPGDYFVSSMGEELVILTRDKQNAIHVLLNSCRHRGMKVCRYDEGNTATFICPYHGWSYTLDGALVGVPRYQEAYRERLDRSRWGLVEVAQMVSYKGTIWATWDPEAPSFLEYLGDMKLYLDVLLDYQDGREGGSELIGGIQKWTIPCNWKFAAENFVGDIYHGATSHQSVDAVGIGPSGKGRRDYETADARRLSISVPRGGHGALFDLLPENYPYIPIYRSTPIVAEYFQHIYEERQRRLGKLAGLMGGPGTIFPNMSFSARQPRTIAVWHPRGALKTEAWRWYLVDRDAPPEVKEVLRHYYMRYAGPAGLTEQDDMENWNYATAASKGAIARRYPYNYEMGLGVGNPHDEVPGLVTQGPSEQGQRGFYQRWVEFMEGRPWER
jgi:phenylpropionate dioxygenase-like ring-hydroxylating dioxygenase large terminal subunit